MVCLIWCLILVLMCIFRATVSAVSCLVVPAFTCIDILISCALNDDDDDDDDDNSWCPESAVLSINQ